MRREHADPRLRQPPRQPRTGCRCSSSARSSSATRRRRSALRAAPRRTLTCRVYRRSPASTSSRSATRTWRRSQAETWTFGLVFNGPGRLDGLTASLDFYNIEVDRRDRDVRGRPDLRPVLQSQWRVEPRHDDQRSGWFLRAVNRNASTGAAQPVDSRYLNTGLISTSGVDLAGVLGQGSVVGWQLYLDNLASFLNEYNTKTTPTDPVLEYKDTLGNGGQYDYRWNYDRRLPLRRQQRLSGYGCAICRKSRTGLCDQPGHDELADRRLQRFRPVRGYTFNERFRLRGGIDNLLDEDPAIVGATPTRCDSNSASTLAVTTTRSGVACTSA